MLANAHSTAAALVVIGVVYSLPPFWRVVLKLASPLGAWSWVVVVGLATSLAVGLVLGVRRYLPAHYRLDPKGHTDLPSAKTVEPS